MQEYIYHHEEPRSYRWALPLLLGISIGACLMFLAQRSTEAMGTGTAKEDELHIAWQSYKEDMGPATDEKFKVDIATWPLYADSASMTP